MNGWSDFQGVNAGYVAELYERFCRDPHMVDAEARDLFEKTPTPPEVMAYAQPRASLPKEPIRKVVATITLAESIRRFGHLAAQLDPLGSSPPGDPSLLPGTHGVTEGDLQQLPASLVAGSIAQGFSNALEVIQALLRIYCSHSGYDYVHLRASGEREWLRNIIESGTFRPPQDSINEAAILERLSQEDAFELFLHRIFPGKTRFSLEGVDILVPIIDEVIDAAAGAGVRQVLIGMGHRGRLNVLAHVLNKPYAQILAEFKDPVKSSKHRADLGWMGDVKYHSGGQRSIHSDQAVRMVISMAPNPSHLEAVDPVIVGMARAGGTQVEGRGAPHFDPDLILPILIHGDAVFPGEGIVAETLNLSRLPSYHVGGTIHIIANNQIGFTTPPEEGRSALFASDLARGFDIPVVHVNADDPDASVEAARIAYAYRTRFHKDFLIDLIGYRRYGHNEGDEPSFTQPLMYRKIAEHLTVRELWAKTLLSRGVIHENFSEELARKYLAQIQSVFNSLEPQVSLAEPIPRLPKSGMARQTQTAVPLERLRELNQALRRLPEGFTLDHKLERANKRKRTILDHLDEKTIDWSSAEELAWASILAEGISIRVSGQDVQRGTFSQRHAVLHDVQTGRLHVPLEALPQARAAFEICNSPLSENAALAFEYGYNVNAPLRLVIWEAQYGDFVNNAQTVLDEFIVSARTKWGLTPSLVLLLPHGLEGQGPDHSSARPERLLQSAADINIRIANCTTAAQYFHLLRRQALLLEKDPLPLVVLTPKSLLRHPLVASTPQELAQGEWQPVINDTRERERAREVRRLIFCSGKVFVDLMSAPQRNDSSGIAICRVEQLYPFPEADLKEVLAGYPALDEVVWLQEGTAKPGRVGFYAFATRTTVRRALPAVLRGPATQFKPRRRILELAYSQSGKTC